MKRKSQSSGGTILTAEESALLKPNTDADYAISTRNPRFFYPRLHHARASRPRRHRCHRDGRGRLGDSTWAAQSVQNSVHQYVHQYRQRHGPVYIWL